MTRRTMPIADLFRDYTTGDGADWPGERAELEKIHADHLAELRISIAQHGIREPVLLCPFERRVIDGHHRVLVAEDLGLVEVPVTDAWDTPQGPPQ
ncbi:ParB/Srx family N-terminal domain-containing protein [Embleya sp. NPDC059237]|uniref:ParB/Srx family N-terminal domain-containing protein n=1 Tax=Embleya sp. NPDC059237 TaxID=3346784 RepID=UPI0036BEE8F1